MRLLAIGATGTIGKAVVAALRGHEVVQASHHKAPDRDGGSITLTSGVPAEQPMPGCGAVLEPAAR